MLQSPLQVKQGSGGLQQAPHDSITQGSMQQTPHNSTSQGSMQQAPHDSITQGSMQQAPHNSTSQGSMQSSLRVGQADGGGPTTVGVGCTDRQADGQSCSGSNNFPLPFDVLHACLWEKLTRWDKRAVRIASRQAREHSNQCVTSLTLYFSNMALLQQPSHCQKQDAIDQLATFPLLEELNIVMTGSSEGGQLSPSSGPSGKDLAQVLRSGHLASERVTRLGIAGLKSSMCLAAMAFPAMLQSSLVNLRLVQVRLDGPVFASLVPCVALRSLELVEAEFVNEEAPETLSWLSQLESLSLTDCMGPATLYMPSILAMPSLSQLLINDNKSILASQFLEYIWEPTPKPTLTGASGLKSEGSGLKKLALRLYHDSSECSIDSSADGELALALEPLTQLEELQLSGWCHFQDGVAQVLAGFPNFHTLEVSDVSLTRPQPLPHLQCLRIETQQSVPLIQLEWLLGGTTALRHISLPEKEGMVFHIDVTPNLAGDQSYMQALSSVAQAISHSAIPHLLLYASDENNHERPYELTSDILSSLHLLSPNLVSLSLLSFHLTSFATATLASQFSNLRRVSLIECLLEEGVLGPLPGLRYLTYVGIDSCVGLDSMDVSVFCGAVGALDYPITIEVENDSLPEADLRKLKSFVSAHLASIKLV